jgi:general secretion pathway protein E
MAAQVFSASQLIDLLVRAGKLQPADADKTRQLAAEESQSVGLLLSRIGLVSDRDVAAAYAEILERPLLSDEQIPLVPPTERVYKESFLRESKILPLGGGEEGMLVATADPENTFALNALAMTAGKPIAFSIGTVSQIEKALDTWFGTDQADAEAVEAAESALEDSEAIDRLRDLASEAPVVRYVNLVIQRAVEARASDIHVEPIGADLRIRFRIDGVLQSIEMPAVRSAAAVVSRIKLMAKMNIAERRLPQDGRIQARIQGAAIDLRVATVPIVDGESVVLRILDQERVSLDLDTLGFDADGIEKLQQLIERPHGILLVTGPTGSGKTTTLYALLRRLNSTERKILTIEDPVEYRLEGINQIQVKTQIGLDFSSALRSIVRQDPDVIMVGEMRDLDTARIAIQSALTGHLVLSTLHTNDAGSSITRLLDMGIDDYLVTSAVNGVIAQRLVRRLCRACRTPYEPSSTLVERLGVAHWPKRSPVLLYAKRGCAECEYTGYRGRTVIAELLLLSDRVRAAILSGRDGKAIERLAVEEEGMRSMWSDGMKKAVDGVTSFEEVSRVAYS